MCVCAMQVMATTCLVSATLIEAAKHKAEELAKQQADKTLQARRSSGGGAAAAAASSNGEAAGAAAGKKSGGASPAKQRVGVCVQDVGSSSVQPAQGISWHVLSLAAAAAAGGGLGSFKGLSCPVHNNVDSYTIWSPVMSAASIVGLTPLSTH